MTSSSKNFLALFTLTTVMLGVVSCGVGGGGGGGGGGETPNYTGNGELKVERDSLDSGDLTQVTLTIHDINQEGVIVKFRYPGSLGYAKNTALLYSGDAKDWVSINPTNAVRTDSGTYLVFFLSKPSDDETNRALIYFNIKALSPDPSAYVEFDLDNNDPNIPDSREFSATDPNFSPMDHWSIDIAGEPGQATPTPGGTTTPTPTPAG